MDRQKKRGTVKSVGYRDAPRSATGSRKRIQRFPWVLSLILKQSGVRKRLLRLWREDSELWRNVLSISPVWDSCIGTEQVGHGWKLFNGADE